jgi:hypothetical protein
VHHAQYAARKAAPGNLKARIARCKSLHCTALPTTLQVKCLVGCIFHNFGNFNLNSQVKSSSAACSKNSTQYDYSSLTIPWL